MNDADTKFIKSKEATKILKVDPSTLRRWADTKKIEFIRTPGGARLYNIKSLQPQELLKTVQNEKVSYTYCRVSTQGQKDDLGRQVSFMQNKFPNHKVITDIGSGINFNRKGLKTILEACLQGAVQEVVVAYKDRLCRFGFELIEWIFREHGVKLVVLNQEATSPEEELSRDLISIINVFSARINGRKKYKTKGKKSDEQPKKEEKV
jgi:putative resolvase